MSDLALAWLDGLPDLSIGGVTGVPGVPPQKSAVSVVTPPVLPGVTRVPERVSGTPVTPVADQGVPRKPAEMLEEHRLHPEHLEHAGALAELKRGVALLGKRPRRASCSDAIWSGIVADAQRVMNDGWAAQALALGWGPHDLFGVGRDGSAEWGSLAVWLAGRSITMLDDHRAYTAEGSTYYVERWGRPNTPFNDPIYLWEWAK